ncbi:MAG: NAD(P)-dependent oxidoreductase [Candidatus Microsaccharimonas sp.]
MSESITPELPSKRVLITGATGFLGKYTVDEFRDNGYQVIATGRNKANLDPLQHPNVTTAQLSLEELATSDIQADTVVHAAALSSAWGKWSDFYNDNVVGTEQVIRYAQRNNVDRLVYVSSPSIYTGQSDRLNIREDDFDANNTLNHYIRSKIMAETALLRALNEQIINELVIIRPRGLIGVGDPSMIPRLLKANQKIGIPLFNNGDNLVDVTCVENVAYSLRLAAEAKVENGSIYNITNGEPRTFKSILDTFFEEIGETPSYRNMNFKTIYTLASALEKLYTFSPTHAEPPLTRYTVSTLAFSQTLDISKAKQELGYEPQISIDEGIKAYAADYKEHHA